MKNRYEYQGYIFIPSGAEVKNDSQKADKDYIFTPSHKPSITRRSPIFSELRDCRTVYYSVDEANNPEINKQEE